jgi:hypothetical protein
MAALLLPARVLALGDLQAVVKSNVLEIKGAGEDDGTNTFAVEPRFVGFEAFN